MNNDLLTELERLEKCSSRLQTTTETWSKLARQTAHYCKTLLQNVDSAKAFDSFDPVSFQQQCTRVFSEFPEEFCCSDDDDDGQTRDNNDDSDDDKEEVEDDAISNTKNLEARLDELIRNKIDPLLIHKGYNPMSPYLFGYVPGGGIVAAAVADMLVDITNVVAGNFALQPGLAAMEHQLISFLGSVIGWGAAGGDEVISPLRQKTRYGGFLTSGASMATFSAVVTAREATGIADPAVQDRNLKVKGVSRFVVYCTKEVHSCFFKSLNLAGCGEGCVGQALVKVNYVDVDEEFRMDVTDLKRRIETDVADGNHRPWLIVGSAGTVNTGSVDPLFEIGAIAKQHKMWFHVDGAYGGLFCLVSLAKKKHDKLHILRGIELADSLVVDPHKTMFLPYGTGALLVKDFRWLAAANSVEDSKDLTTKHPFFPLPDAVVEVQNQSESDQCCPVDQKEKANDHFLDSPVMERNLFPSSDEFGPESSRHARSVRLWLPLQLFGVAPFRAALEEKMLLAQYLADKFASRSDLFELAMRNPHLSIVVFRVVVRKSSGDDDDEDSDRKTKKLLAKLNDRGKIFLTATTLGDTGGKKTFWLRFAIVVFRTHRRHVDEGFEEIVHCLDDAFFYSQVDK